MRCSILFIQREHGIDIDKDLQRHVLSVNTARNCLVHRRGIVSERDLDSQNDKTLTVEWRKLYAFLKDEDGEHEIVIGQPTKKESLLCVKMLDGKKIFSLGDQIKFTTQEFADITWGLFAFGRDLVQKMSETGRILKKVRERLIELNMVANPDDSIEWNTLR